mmetsp:Transcript_59701/g.151287  ORF Transcript_59701/g.151287 Transcript_59701/m.151287 type:complete len:231 (-) Transcript_59701:545-1237(-)
MFLNPAQVVHVAMLNEERQHVIVGGHHDCAKQSRDSIVRHDVVLDRVDTHLLQNRRQASDDLRVLVNERHRHAHAGRLQRHDVLAILALAALRANREHMPVTDLPAPRPVSDWCRDRFVEVLHTLTPGPRLLDLSALPSLILRCCEDIVADDLVLLREGLRHERPENAEGLVLRVHETNVVIDGVLHLLPVGDDVVQCERSHARDLGVHRFFDTLSCSVDRLHNGTIRVP